MAGLSTESTPRERLARLLSLMKRTRRFRKATLVILGVCLSVALGAALATRRVYRSETTVLYRDGIQTGPVEGESAAARAARLGPKLKDLLYARPRLEEVIVAHGLFPEKTRRSMLDGLEEMAAAVGFRARASDSYVISFTYDDPVIAHDVTAELAAKMIESYDAQNLDSATLTRDFLGRKQAEADAGVDEASRRLAQFLAEHPQFQWGVNDSPYAPVPGVAGSAPLTPRAPPAHATADPALGNLEHELARVEAELYSGQPLRLPGPPGAAVVEAERQRDAVAADLAAAVKAQAAIVLAVKPAHPDAIAAAARVRAARQALAAADAALVRARAPEPTASPVPAPDLPAGRRAELERLAAALRRQIEDHRASGARSAPPPSAARPLLGAAASTTVELETEWHRLRLDLDRAREKLHTIQQNARAADLAADAVAKQGREEMRILEPATLPVHPERGRGRVFFAGAAIAIFLALAYASGRVLLDDTLLDEGDVAAIGGPQVLVELPHLGPPPASPPERAIVPAVPREEDLDSDDDPPLSPVSAVPVPSERGLALRPDYPIVEAVFDDPEVEVIGADVRPAPGTPLVSLPPAALGALRILRHRLEQRRGDGSLVLSVLSPGPSEGKTTLALRLALTLAEADRARVILVEGNFERPRLASALGLRIPPEVAFSRQIQDRREGRGVAWGVVRLSPSLSLLAESGEVAAQAEAVHSTYFEAALAALRRSHEYVVIDGPSVVGSGDANVLEGASDGVLLLVRVGVTKGESLSRATQQLGERRVLGVVLNDVGREG
jgi:Mrp family chromosome partitioning ATPase